MPQKRGNPANLGGRRVLCEDGLVRTMVDANFIYSATLAQPDVDHAVCGDPQRCAISHAVERIEANHGRPSSRCVIGADKAYLIRDEIVLRFAVPRNEAALIRTFDASGLFPVGFTVHLTPVRPSDRLGARPKERGTKRGGTHKSVGARRLPTRHLRGPRFVTRESLAE